MTNKGKTIVLRVQSPFDHSRSIKRAGIDLESRWRTEGARDSDRETQILKHFGLMISINKVHVLLEKRLVMHLADIIHIDYGHFTIVFGWLLELSKIQLSKPWGRSKHPRWTTAAIKLQTILLPICRHLYYTSFCWFVYNYYHKKELKILAIVTSACNFSRLTPETHGVLLLVKPLAAYLQHSRGGFLTWKNREEPSQQSDVINVFHLFWCRNTTDTKANHERNSQRVWKIRNRRLSKI